MNNKEINNNKNWSISQSSNLYGLDFWGDEYFSINDKGNVQVHPYGKDSSSIDLYEMISSFKERSIRLPLLLRFPDIIQAQMKKICVCFNKAIQDQDYQGNYYGVFPIKVNQQRHVIEDIIHAGKDLNFGLEAGSKPELLIALSYMDNPKALIVCNGFKDKSYIEMALLSQKAGRNIFLVVERQKELDLILEMSKQLQLKPQIGFRLKLNTQSKGFWGKSSGEYSKFGLTSQQLVSSIEKLKQEDFLDCVKLIHFHIGSQIPSIQPIKLAIKECAMIMSELYLMKCPIEYVDVGGGLGINYDGSGATRSSTDYDIQEYANDIVFALQSLCEKKKIPQPHIISESGRFLVAQSSILVFNILDKNSIEGEKNITISENSSSFLKEMYDIYKNITHISYNESFNDLIEKKKQIYDTFIYGMLSLTELALAEKIYWASVKQLTQLTKNKEDYEDIFLTLKKQLTDTYFCNFSIFQSLPDSWALSYIFPVLPIHRLREKPNKQAYLVDLTCDSDGQISKIVDYKNWEIESFMPVHDLKKNEPYLMGIFLTGAYQEILGDLHNLFGDTDAVHIRVKDNNKYIIEHRVKADSISEVLEYVEFHGKQIIDKLHNITEQSIIKGDITRQEADLLVEKFEENLSRSTYLK
ncbi:MAG: biosynthetic arginine decarboxylase [Bdellovibrionaceae bacterium]|nr:biosynthetic arginine decarboxylase [Pseudobdellovibrionaceae bacterium]